jgi:methenyltetrahydrofolate cyclohydrolase
MVQYGTSLRIVFLDGGSRMLIEGSIASYLDTLANPTATPGGGSTAAIMGAMAAALVCMVCSLTLGKKHSPEFENEFGELLLRAQAARQRLTLMIEADVEAYGAVMSAYTLPRGSEADRTVRSEAIQQALAAATLAPLECVRACGDVMDMSRMVAEKGNLNAAGEAALATLAAHAALRGAALNVYINTGSIRDRNFVDGTLAELKTIVRDRDDLVASVVEMVKTRVSSSPS